MIHSFCHIYLHLTKNKLFLISFLFTMQPSYPRTTYIRKGWVVRQLIKCLVFTGLMGFIIEQVSLFTWFLMVFHLHSCLYTQYVLYFSVHKSNCEEFEASIEREFLECYRESIEIISANIICLALHVLLFFPSLVSIFDNFVLSLYYMLCIFQLGTILHIQGPTVPQHIG